jgi:hypothetical protein
MQAIAARLRRIYAASGKTRARAMATAPNKTQATTADVAAFIAAVPDAGRRADAETLVTLMARLSGEQAAMWGPSIIGFGSYSYRYDSGRTGTMCRIGFSPRKAETVVYLVDGFTGQAELLARLGRHRIGKSCLYLKRLADIDISVLEAMISASLASMATRYPPE